jgi:hypothetical protein
MKPTLFKLNFVWKDLPYTELFIGLLFVLLSAIVMASPATGLPAAGGIWLSDEPGYQFNEIHKEELVSSLKRITGLESLYFTDKGLLTPGASPEGNSGSEQARQILQWALESKRSFTIEDHSGSPKVNFGQLDGITYENASNGLRLTIWRVRLDFKDFREMQAPHEVRKTFDPGFTLLHELLHGLGYKDATRQGEIGECEKFVNQARSELGLPLRDEYFGDPIQSVRDIITVRLRFRSKRFAQQTPVHRPLRDQFHYLFFLLPTSVELPAGSQDDLHTEALMRARKKRW